MAQYLSNMLCVGLLMAASVARSEDLRDPTMPPASLQQANSANSNALPTGPVLQSVMIGPQQKAAVINGQYVKLGKKYEQSVLVSVSQTEAVLRAADGSKQTLKMEFSAQKKIGLKTVKTSESNINNNKRESL